MQPWKIAATLGAIAIAAPVACSIVGTAGSVTTAPGRVVSKTLETDNIINTYEGFYRQKASYEARVAQIATHKLVAEQVADDAAESNRVRVELAAMRQSCRELALTYNNASQMMNKAIFKDGDLPETLSENACEA